MKIKPIICCLSGLLAGGGTALALSGEPVILEKGQNYRVIETVGKFIAPDGQQTTVKGQYTELQAGMYYWDNEQWIESKEVVEPFPQGAIARQGCFKVIFNWNLNTAGSVDLELPDGQRLRGHPLGIVWTDLTRQEMVWVATIRDCVGGDFAAQPGDIPGCL